VDWPLKPDAAQILVKRTFALTVPRLPLRARDLSMLNLSALLTRFKEHR
jgi:hypothetical protein